MRGFPLDFSHPAFRQPRSRAYGVENFGVESLKESYSRRVVLYALVVLVSLLAAVAGPSSAIAMISDLGR